MAVGWIYLCLLIPVIRSLVSPPSKVEWKRHNLFTCSTQDNFCSFVENQDNANSTQDNSTNLPPKQVIPAQESGDTTSEEFANPWITRITFQQQNVFRVRMVLNNLKSNEFSNYVDDDDDNDVHYFMHRLEFSK